MIVFHFCFIWSLSEHRYKKILTVFKGFSKPQTEINLSLLAKVLVMHYKAP